MSYSGIILAGGKSSRMGQDKALLEINGKPMIQNVSELLRGFCDEIIVASSNNDHARFGDFMVSDIFENAGPQAGIHAGLLAAKNDKCIVISCDTPFITKKVLEVLLAKSDERPITVAGTEEWLHPLVGVYTRSASKTISARLNGGMLSMYPLLKIMDAKIVYFSENEEKAFENINTQEEWKQWNEK